MEYNKNKESFNKLKKYRKLKLLELDPLESVELK